MTDARRVRIEGPAMVVRGNDIDTDRITPARYLKGLTFEHLGGYVFADDRVQLRERGQVHPFDEPAFAGAKILLVNKNFGCGSSREHAPQAIHRWGIQAIVGESFSEIFFGNSVAIGMPWVTVDESAIGALQTAAERDPGKNITVDLETRTIGSDSATYALVIPEGARQQFITGGWDALSVLLSAKADIEHTARRLPYLNGWR